MASQQPLVSTPRSGDILGGLDENRTRPYGVTGHYTNRYTTRPNMEGRVRFELTVLGICSPLRWATPPPSHYC